MQVVGYIPHPISAVGGDGPRLATHLQGTEIGGATQFNILGRPPRPNVA